MVTNWILTNNLEPFCNVLSGFCDYRFDDADWDAISFGIRETDAEQDVWFDYPLEGTKPALLSIALDPGSSVVFVKVSSDIGIEAQAKTLVEIATDYRLVRG